MGWLLGVEEAMTEGDWSDYHPEARAEEGMRGEATEPAPDTIRFALAIPTCADWLSERAVSLIRLKEALGHRPQWYREFRSREPNWVWSRKLWQWGADMAREGATHLLQLQDDVVPMPRFWPTLRAMVEANPERVIGLESNHPGARNLAHIGRRWYRSRAWLVGPQYVLPLTGPDSLVEFLAWLKASEEKLTAHQREHEDVLLSTWLAQTGRDCWHPIPAIADHDVSIESTYGTTPGHIDDHRRPTVLWHSYGRELETMEYWQPSTSVELLPGPSAGECSFCGKAPGFVRSPVTAACLCRQCLAGILGNVLTRVPA